MSERLPTVENPVASREPVESHPPVHRSGVLRRALAGWDGRTGLGAVTAVVLAGLLAPLLAPADPGHQVSGADLLRPSPTHLLGTDEVGRDVLSRVLFGIREDMMIIAVAVLAGALIGIVLGLLSVTSRIADSLIQRVFDVVFAFPSVVLAALIAAFMGPGRGTIVAVVVILNAPMFGRLARTAMRSQIVLDYVVAARVVGVPKSRLVIRHILPNSVDSLIVQAALSCSQAAFLEGGLSLLGFGVPQSTPTLGNITEGSLQYLANQPFYALGPMLAIVLLVAGFNLLADALNRSLRNE